MNKKLVLTSLLSLSLLTSCSLSDIFGSVSWTDSSNPSNITSEEVSSNSETSINSNQTSSNEVSSSSSTSTSLSSSTSSEDNPEEYTFSLKSPSFEKRIVNNRSELTYEDLFSLYNRVSINIEISDEELQMIQEDNNIGPKPEIYRRADKVTINITNNNNVYTFEFDDVGIRQKGNTSRNYIFNGDHLNLNHYKLSFDETFEDVSIYGQDYVDAHAHPEYNKRDFLGLNSIDFKWDKNEDCSRLKEIYASYLYRASGLIIQHIGLSTVKINHNGIEDNFGLCYIHEATSKSMIKRALQSNDQYINMSTWKKEKAGTFGYSTSNYGDYYKITYGIGAGRSDNGGDLSNYSVSDDRVGVKDTYGNYIPAYELKTNKDISNHSTLKNAVNKINNSSYQEISKYVDLDYLAVEEAVSYVIGNPDAMRYNYNNYMIYFRKTDGKMIIIPIDNDRCFGITKDWNLGDALTSSDFSASSNKDCSYSGNRNNLLNKTIFSNENNDCKDLYYTALNEIKASSWVNASTFSQYYDIARNTYSDYYFSLNDNNMSFETYINRKKNLISDSEGGEIIVDPTTLIKDIDNLYVYGTINNWGNDGNHIKVLHDDNYLYADLYINQLEQDGNLSFIKIKFAGYGPDYNYQNYSISDGYLVSGVEMPSARIGGLEIGKTYRLAIDRETYQVSVFEI